MIMAHRMFYPSSNPLIFKSSNYVIHENSDFMYG